MKSFWIISIVILIVVIGFFVGSYLYKINEIDNENKNKVATKIEDECTEIAELANNGMLDSLEANSEEEKVSPKCILTIKKLYTKCDHIIESSKEIEESAINLNQDEFEKKYKDWEVQKFTSDEIVLYEEVDDFCHEHYRIKDVDGKIGIYEVDEDGNGINLIKITDIWSAYLTELDQMDIEKGIDVYTKRELNKTLEDFE